jgi:hypothetical protein
MATLDGACDLALQSSSLTVYTVALRLDAFLVVFFGYEVFMLLGGNVPPSSDILLQKNEKTFNETRALWKRLCELCAGLLPVLCTCCRKTAVESWCCFAHRAPCFVLLEWERRPELIVQLSQC